MFPFAVHYFYLSQIKLSPYENNFNHLDKYFYTV